jgi:hypothetical protein
MDPVVEKLISRSSPAAIFSRLFVVVFAVAIWVRLCFVGMERLWPDEALYAWCAQRIFEHPSLIFSKEIIAFHPPLFPALMSVAHFFLSPEAACRWTVLIVNVLGVAGIYVLGVRLKSHFLGCFAALVLAFNFLYFNYAFLILNDGLLSVVLIGFFILLLNVTPTPPCRRDLFVGVAACAVILTKWAGILVVPFLCLYYLLAFQEIPLAQRWRKLFVPLAMSVGVTVLLLVNNQIQLGHWMPDTTALTGLYLVKPVWYYLQDMPNIFIVKFLIPFFIAGLWFMFQKENRTFLGVGVWFILFFTAISLMKEKDLRYTLPVFPQMVLIAGLGFEDIITRLFKDERLRFKLQVAFLVATIGFFAWSFRKIPNIMRMVGQEFTGFREAGQVVKDEVALGNRPLVVAASPRIMRYYTGINFPEFGGRLMELPKKGEELAEVLRRAQTPVILELDIWERTKGHWVLPLSDETLAFLNQLQLKPVKIIEKEHRVAKGVMRKDQAIIILRYDP